MKKLLTILLFVSLLCTFGKCSTGQVSSIKQDSRSFEISYSPLAKPEALVEIIAVDDKEFDDKIVKLTKEPGTYLHAYLPAGSDKTFMYIKKSYIKSEYSSKVVELKNKLYIVYYLSESRQGFEDVTIETDSVGGFRYRRENNWVSGFDGLTVANGVVILQNGFSPNKFPLNTPPLRVSYRTERVFRNKELNLFLVDNKSNAKDIGGGKKVNKT